MNPLTVKIWETNGVGYGYGYGNNNWRRLWHCGNHIQQDGLRAQDCIALSVDNASVNMGDGNSIKSRVMKEKPSVLILGCPCHMCTTVPLLPVPCTVR